MEAISSYELGMIFNQIKEYDVIGIDEGQFVGFSFICIWISHNIYIMLPRFPKRTANFTDSLKSYEHKLNNSFIVKLNNSFIVSRHPLVFSRTGEYG